MNHVRIAAALRRQVRERASGRCEYCSITEVEAFFPHKPDHIIAQKHGGQTVLHNLAPDRRKRCPGEPQNACYDLTLPTGLRYAAWLANAFSVSAVG